MQITANINEFLLIYPQFNTDILKPIATYYLNDNIAWAECKWDLKRFGCRLNTAIYLLTAHRTFLNSQAQAGQEGQGGKVASASVGEVSVSYATMPTNDTFDYWLTLSPYGQELAALLNMLSGLPKYYGGSFERVF